jgi:hypothetical protein
LERATLIGKEKTRKVTIRVLNVNKPARVMLCVSKIIDAKSADSDQLI